MEAIPIPILDYESDKLVVDPERDEMNIHGDDGYWHRPIELDDGPRMACGLPLDFRLRQGTRPNSLGGPLCPLCFSPYEIEMSAKLEREADRKRRAKALGSQPIQTIEIPPKKGSDHGR